MNKLLTINDDLKNVLRTQSKCVTAFGKKQLNHIIDNMFAVMEEHNGAGIAAPQIGILQRIIIVGRTVLINPMIVQDNNQTQLDDEGCLSIPDVKRKIQRLDRVAVAFLDIKRSQHIEWFYNVASSVVQHEIDHLNGKLIIDYDDIKN